MTSWWSRRPGRPVGRHEWNCYTIFERIRRGYRWNELLLYLRPLTTVKYNLEFKTIFHRHSHTHTQILRTVILHKFRLLIDTHEPRSQSTSTRFAEWPLLNWCVQIHWTAINWIGLLPKNNVHANCELKIVNTKLEIRINHVTRVKNSVFRFSSSFFLRLIFERTTKCFV